MENFPEKKKNFAEEMAEEMQDTCKELIGSSATISDNDYLVMSLIVELSKRVNYLKEALIELDNAQEELTEKTNEIIYKWNIKFNNKNENKNN